MTRALASRRAMRVAAAALASAAAVVAVAGCGAGAPANQPGMAVVVPPHTFVDLVPALPTDLDVSGTPDTAADLLLPSWSGQLVRPAPATPGPNAVLAGDDDVVPYLATSWTREPDGDYVFELRRGVRGPTGDPLTAQDVRWSLERALATDPEAPFLYSLARIERADPVTILGPGQVRINVSGPSPFTLSVLASDSATIYDSARYRAHASAADPWALSWGGSHSASYSAYSVARYVPRREIVLAANPGFWRRPYYTRVVIRALASSGERKDDVLDGSATHTSGLDWSDFVAASEDGPDSGAAATILENGPQVISWDLDISSGPLANPDVREAINLGVDRAQLAGALLGSYDTPSVDAIPASFGQAQPNPFDPAEARSLMRAAGYDHPITIDVYVDQTVVGTNIGSLLSYLYSQMLEIDVTLHTIFVDDPDQLLALEAARRVQSSIQASGPLLGGPAMLLEQDDDAALDPVSPAAEEGYSNATLQGVLDQLRSTPAGSGADALVTEAASIVDTDLPTINLVTVPVQNVTRANVTGYAAYTDPVTYYEYLHPVGTP